MKLVVCFPGIGYHCDKPLLYYGRRVAESVGYKEYKNVEYVNRIGNVKGDPVKMQAAFEDLYGQTEEILKDIDFSGYDSILFLSKSVGTIIATTYAERHKIPCRHVLYTPLEATFDNCASDLSGRSDSIYRNGRSVGGEHRCNYRSVPKSRDSGSCDRESKSFLRDSRCMEESEESGKNHGADGGFYKPVKKS